MFCAGVGISNVHATHNIAGEITYTYLGNNSIEITLTTYTDPSEAQVDRCTADLEIWKDNPQSATDKIADILEIPRINGPLNVDPLYPNQVTCPGQNMGEYIIGTIKRNVYRAVYTFNGPGKFLIRYFDVARINNINNLVNGGEQAFFVESTVFIAPIFGDENSPQFLNHPIDFACQSKLWTHNPGAYDPDGDSLVFTLVECRQYNPPMISAPITCTGFQFPGLYANNGPMTMDSQTGLITWDAPEATGWYNLAYKVEEYRNGILIGTTFRDMAIEVNPCDNNPPVIETITDTCIYAGETLRFEVVAYDPDFSENPPDSLYFYLNNNGINNNGPFAVANSPATLTITQPLGQPIPPDFPIETWGDTIKAEFEWATLCEHIRPLFYQVDFYAHDNRNYADSTSNLQLLSTHHIVKIRVIPRPLEGLVATASNGAVQLEWDPHACNDAAGYEIYRKTSGGGSYSQDTVCCEGDPGSLGYELVGVNTGWSNTTFLDDNGGDRFPFGRDICYVVRAFFDNGLTTCTTEEVCVQIDKDFAILLQDSIDVTAPAGQIYVSWSQPTKIDTAFFPRPFTYDLLRADEIAGPANWVTVASSLNFSDTTYLDAGMDTEQRGYRYRVDTYDANGELIGEGNNGSSIFLTITEADKALTLTWREVVPWTNRIYYIYRADDFVGPLTLIDSVPGGTASVHSYTDTGLENFEDYCYVVVSEGEYDNPSVPDSVRNASQRACGVPQDQEPPCISSIAFDTTKDCIAHTIRIEMSQPDSSCAGDLDFFTVYFADNRDAPYEIFTTVDSGTTVIPINGPNGSIADCYGITATDTNGNESQMIVFCFENCPQIEISNVFTPNGDGINDYFAPVSDRNIRIAQVQIFDRWGSLIYGSVNVSNPRQLWDGNTTGGKAVPEGVYYYVIRYEEDRLPNYIPKPPLVGHVNLLR